MANVYGFGPEFAGAQIVMNGATGDLLAIPAGVGPTTIPDEALPLLPVWDSDLDIDPVATYPKFAGGGLAGALYPMMPDAKRMGKATIPAGTITKMRVYADALPTGGDARLKGVIYNANGTVAATTEELILGRNQVTSLAPQAQTASITALGDNTWRLTGAGTGIAEGVVFGPRGPFNILPGETFTISAMVRTNATTPPLQFQFRQGSVDNTYVTQINSTNITTVNGEWKKYTFTGTALTTANSTGVTASLKLVSDGTVAGQFDVKEVMLVRGTQVPPRFYDNYPTQGWWDLPLTSNLAWGGGTVYFGVQAGSDYGAATPLTTFQSVSPFNGTFLSDVSGWSANGTGAAISYDTTVKRNGPGSLKMVLTNNQTIDNLVGSQTVAVNPGDIVTASAWINPTVTIPFGRLNGKIGSVGFNDSPGTTCPAGQWTKLTFSLTVPMAGSLFLYVSAGAAGSTLNYNIDDMTFQVQRRHSSDVSTARVASGPSIAQNVNLVKNPRASVDVTGFSSYIAPGAGGSIGFSRITTDSALGLSGVPTTCVEYTGNAGTTTNNAFMMSEPVRDVPTGEVVQVAAAFKAVSGQPTTASLKVRTADPTNTTFAEITVATIANPALGRWYFLSGTATLPSDCGDIRAMVSTQYSANTAFTARLGHVQVVRKPSAGVGLVDGDYPACEWDGTAGASVSRGPMGRVNYVRDPRTVTAGAWGAQGQSLQIVNDATSPTGSALRLHSNTITTAYAYDLSMLTSDLRVPSLPGETWTFSGWMKANQAAVDRYPSMSPTHQFACPSLYWRDDGTYYSTMLPISQRPTVANVWVPFAVSGVLPSTLTSLFIRLANTDLATSAPETFYTGLKLEKGVHPTGDWFDGSSSFSTTDWYGTANNSPSIMWQAPDVGDTYADGAAALPTFQPAAPAFGDRLSLQAVYQTP